MKNNLRVAIITDFLDVESDWINGHFIFDELTKSHASLNPYLVSGQWIWKLENWIKIETNETILSVTEKLTKWETKLVIGTRGILGEWWDCPAVNTLIDLTGVSAYMSVNQVHGRAIRLDKENPEKVANIYDIICLGNWYQWMRDFERLEKKHSQFYWVDDSGLIIKELDHIYPQLERMIANPEKINSYTIKKSSLRSMVRELWGIGGEYKNEEIFSLSIEILRPYESLYLPSKIKFRDMKKLLEEKKQWVNLLELGNTTYHKVLRQWIEEIIDATLQVMRPFGLIPWDFNTFILNWTENGSITIISDYRDPLVSKKFIETIAPLFNTITNQKYILKNKDIIKFKMEESFIYKVLLFILLFFITILWGWFMFYIISTFSLPKVIWGMIIPLGILLYWIMTYQLTIFYKNNIVQNNEQIIKAIQVIFFNDSNSFGLPDAIVSNEEKRKWFTWKEYGAIKSNTKWYDQMWSYSFLKLIVKEEGSSFYFTKYVTFIVISTFILLILIGISKNMWTPFYELISNRLIIIIWSIWAVVLITIICIIWLIILRIIFSLLFYLYFSFIKILNFLKRRKVIQLTWSIEPTSQSDIGKPSFLSAKIEKLWI